MQVVRKKSISAGHFHGQKYGTAKNSSIRNRGDAYHRLVNTYRGDAYADRSPLDFGDVGHAEIVRDVNFT